MRTVAMIPVRAGSKRIPGKNMKEIAGKPLVQWVIEAALEAGLETWVSTDSTDIFDLAMELGANGYMRASVLCEDNIEVDNVVLEFTYTHVFDRLVTLYATNPLTTAEDIKSAIKKCEPWYINSALIQDGKDSAISVVPKQRWFWVEDDYGIHSLNFDHRMRPQSQGWNSSTYMENGAIYVSHRNGILKEKSRIHGKIGLYEMSQYTEHELDEPEDWPVVEELLRKHKCH